MGKLLLVPIGFLLIIASPFVLWSAQSQERAADYQRARPAEQVTEGYLKVRGEATADNPFSCPEGSSHADSDADCIYEEYVIREYRRAEVERCVDNPQSLRVIETLDRQECDAEGINCNKCYLVEELNWEIVDSSSKFAASRIGDFRLNSLNEAIVIGASEHTSFSLGANTRGNSQVGDVETNYSYIVDGTEVIVVGNSDGDGVISAAGDTFVFSALSDTETLAELERQDSSSAFMLRILSASLMVFGFIMLANGFLALPMAFVRVFPVVGTKVADKLGSVVSVIAGLIGLVVWGVVFAIVIILKNIVIFAGFIVLLVAVLAGVIYLVNSKRRSSDKVGKVQVKDIESAAEKELKTGNKDSKSVKI